jgi:hypothetical protein
MIIQIIIIMFRNDLVLGQNPCHNLRKTVSGLRRRESDKIRRIYRYIADWSGSA